MAKYCISQSRGTLSWHDFEVVRHSRKDKVLNQFQSFRDFLKYGLHLDIGCYSEVSLLFVGCFAPPIGLSFSPLMKLRYYACHISWITSKTLEVSAQKPHYVNEELARLLLMLMIEYARSLVVGAAQKSKHNNRVTCFLCL